MLPSRGIVRSLPSGGMQRQFISRNAPPRTLLGHGRQFGTLRRNMGGSNGLLAGSAPHVKARQVAAPIALGSVASARNLSWSSLAFWSSGKKKDDAATTSTPSPTETAAPAPTEPASLEASKTAATPAATPAADSASSLPADVASSVDASQADLNVISDVVNSGSEILSRTEGIGYLSSLGLNYGYGFTSTMQWILEHVQVYSGMGWAGAIITTAILMRVAMFYPQIQSTKFTFDMKRMQDDPRHAEVMQKIQRALRDGDRMAQQQAQALNGMLRREYNVPMVKMLWSFLPIPFSIGLFRIITGMTHLPVPSLETAGWFWFTDLTVADPYMILPAMATGLMVLGINMNAKNSTPSQKSMMKKMKYVLVPVMLFGTSFLSAAVNLMGAALGFATLVSTYLLNQNAFRRALGIPELVPPPPPAPEPLKPMYEEPRQPQSFRDRISSGLEDTKKSISDSISNATGNYRGTEEERNERQRKETIRKLEEKRREQERAHFEEKYKGKR